MGVKVKVFLAPRMPGIVKWEEELVCRREDEGPACLPRMLKGRFFILLGEGMPVVRG
jgi:hypothetical protein